MAGKAGSLVIDLAANTATLKSDFTKASALVNGYKRQSVSAFKSVNKAVFSLKGAVVGLAGAAGIGALVKSQADAAHQAVSYARALKDSTQQVMAYQAAAKTVNIENDKMVDILKDVQEKIGDAFATGGGEAADVIERLGLNIRDLAGASPTQQLTQIASALGSVGTQAEKVQIMEALASDASLLLPLLGDNASELKRLAEEAILTGQALSDFDAAQIKEANDAFKRASGLVGGIGNALAVEVAPYIKYASELMINLAVESGGFGDIAADAMQKVVKGTKAVLWVIERMQVGWQAVKVAVIGMGAGALNVLNRVYQAAGETNKLLGRFGSEGFAASVELMDHMTRGFNQSLDDESNKLVTMTGNLGQAGVMLDSFVAKVKNASVESAASSIAVNAASAPEVPSGIMPTDAQIQSDLEKLQQSLMTKNELIAAESARNHATLDNAYAIGALKHTEYEEAKTRLSKKENDLRRAAAISGVQGALGDIAALTGSKNKKLFAVGKAAAISQALINTYLSVTKTMTEVPYPFNIPLAAAQGAAGLFQVAKIRSQTFSGQAHAGLDRAANEGSYNIRRDEVVLDPGTSKMMRDNVLAASGGGDKTEFNLNLNMTPDSQINNWFDRNQSRVFNGFLDMMNERTLSFAR